MFILGVLLLFSAGACGVLAGTLFRHTCESTRGNRLPSLGAGIVCLVMGISALLAGIFVLI